jgi:photosystem II stability/assembly factor-like uncharacterized protein
MRRTLLAIAAVVSALILTDRLGAPPDAGPELEEGRYPSDWFAMQRAYPGETLNQEAYRAALDQAVFERGALLTTSSMNWTQAGPYNIGGRVTALAVVPGGATIYLGSANGGVFKSVNSGANWAPITDGLASASFSIGALELDPNNSSRLYVGTGEANSANDSYDGNGLYRSPDGGVSWEWLGLAETRRIARVVVDPSNSNRIYVAAMGTQYSTNPDRGLYRSENGGTSWEKVLFVSDSTGACDVIVNPAHPETVFCATWERVRHNTYRRAFGPECRIYRSANYGTTWTPLSNGLPVPSDDVGRIALALAHSRPSTIYAQFITGAASLYNGLGLYRSLDGGQNWTKRDADSDFSNGFGGFGWYFGDMAVDPTNPDKIYCLGQSMTRSLDGGVTFTQLITTTSGVPGNTHVDLHAIWIDPANPNRLYVGGDGGFHWTTNGGTVWSETTDLPISQFYAGAIDPSNASRLLGGTQDNGSLITSGPLAWTVMNIGGDGFQCMVDPTNPNIVFAEYQYSCNNTGPARSTNGGAGFAFGPSGIVAGDKFNWNAPIVMDPANHNIILIASDRVYKSINNGVAYTPVSADLTSNLPSQLLYGTVTTLDISKAAANIYYAGTDDGRVWRSLNSGGSWTEISAGLPVQWVTRVSADPVSPGTVYVTMSGFSSDEHISHVYRSTNNGDAWTSIAGNLPNVPANDLLADPSDPNTLYLATDLGVYITRNLGGTWYPFGQGMPIQAVFDLSLHQGARKLVAATHGRSQWAMDLSALSVGAGPSVSAPRLSLSAPAPNPSRGSVHFDIGLPVEGRVEVTVFDAAGRRVKGLVSETRDAGRHALEWSGRDASDRPVGAGVYFVKASANGSTVTRRIVRIE